MVEVEWSEPAQAQLDQIIDYIDIFDPVAARRIRDRLIALSDSLADYPDRGRPSVADTRELVTVPPYVLQYQVVGDTVTILRIRHGRRQPRD